MNYEELQKAYLALQEENEKLKSQLHTATSMQQEASFALPEAERKARQESAQKNAILQAIPDHIFIMNEAGVYIDYQGNRENLYHSKELIGLHISETGLPQAIIAKILQYNKLALETGEVQLVEYTLPDLNEGEAYYESRSIKYTDNLVMRLVRDITSRKKVEEKIKMAEAYKRVMLRAIPDMIVIMNLEGELLDFRGGYEKAFLFDYQIGMNVREMQMPSGVIDMWLEDNIAAHETSQMQFSEYRLDIAEESYYYETRTIKYTRKLVLKIIRDITERRKAEEKSRLEETRKNAILRAIPDTIFVMNERGDYIDFRGGHGKVFIDPDLIIGSNITDSKMPEKLLLQIKESNLRALQTGEIQFLEYTLQISDKIHHYESRAIRYTKNQVLRIVRDITEQKDAQQENKQLIAELQMLNEELISSEEEIRQTLEHTIELNNEIQRREAYYKTLIDASPDIIICINKQMIIEFMQMPKQQNNIERDEFLGKSLLEIIANEQIRNKAATAIKQVIETLQPTEYEACLIENGTETFYNTYYAPIIANNELISIYILTRDITEPKRAEKELKNMSRNLQTTIDNSQQSTILLDTKGNIILTDVKTRLQVENYLGKSLQIGEPLLDTMPSQLHAGFLENFPKVLNGEHFTVERKVVLPTGTVWVQFSYSPVFDEDMKVVAVVIGQMDITARKETEEYLRRVNADLVNQNKQLSHYSYVVSHNLRSPVATILGLTNLLEMENITDVGTLDLLRMLKLATEKLDDVVKDLNLILSETQIVQENKQSIYFEAELMNIMGSLRQQIQHCNPIIRYEFNQAPSIFASKTLVHNVLFNLFTNALKFRQPHTQLELDIYTEQEEHYTCLIVKDNGMGIDMIKQRENLFKLYKRFHPQIEGKGIGLYILKTQIEMQGGKIEIYSEIELGTTVKVYFANDN